MVSFQRAAIRAVHLSTKRLQFIRRIGCTTSQDAAVIDHTTHTSHRESPPAEPKHEYLMLLRVVLNDKLVQTDAFLADGSCSGAVPEILEKGLVEAHTFLVAGRDVWIVGNDRVDDGGVLCGWLDEVDDSDLVGELADSACGSAWK